MGVGRQGTDDVAEQASGRRSGRDEVDVVDDDADVEGRMPAQCLGHVDHRIFVAGRRSQCRHHGGGEVLGLLVTGVTGHPDLDARRLQRVVAHGLAQHRRLAEPGPGHDQGHGLGPPRRQSPHEVGPEQLVRHRERRTVRHGWRPATRLGRYKRHRLFPSACHRSRIRPARPNRFADGGPTQPGSELPNPATSASDCFRGRRWRESIQLLGIAAHDLVLLTSSVSARRRGVRGRA